MIFYILAVAVVDFISRVLDSAVLVGGKRLSRYSNFAALLILISPRFLQRKLRSGLAICEFLLESWSFVSVRGF